MGSSTKVHHHQFTRGFWEHEPFLSLGCKRLRPLAPKLNHPQDQSLTSGSYFDIKSFIKRESSGREGLRLVTDENKRSVPQVETSHPGGTRWNPTPDQIGILEMLYRSGMRTPNAQQIEQITAELSKYGKIEGKNVFYWFQNHKARERQKLKRNNTMINSQCQLGGAKVNNWVEMESREESRGCKRKSSSDWIFQFLEEEANRTLCKEGVTTLELFPLHPEGR